MWRGGGGDAAEQSSAIPSHKEPRSKPTASEREWTPSYPLCGAARRAEPALSPARRRATPFRSAPSTPKSLPDLNGLSIHSRRGNPSAPPPPPTDEPCAPTQSQRAGSNLKHGPRVQNLPPTPPPQPPAVPPPAPAPAAHRRPARRPPPALPTGQPRVSTTAISHARVHAACLFACACVSTSV